MQRAFYKVFPGERQPEILFGQRLATLTQHGCAVIEFGFQYPMRISFIPILAAEIVIFLIFDKERPSVNDHSHVIHVVTPSLEKVEKWINCLLKMNEKLCYTA